MNGRYCIGQQPFKYFIETDPTVPQWVKNIKQEDIDKWNTIDNKQDIITATYPIVKSGNDIRFAYSIDSMNQDEYVDNTLLTARAVRNILDEYGRTEFSIARQAAYQTFVTSQLENYVSGRIALLNLSSYATNTNLNNLVTRVNFIVNQVNNIDDEVGDISSTREYLITTGNGLNKTYINEGTLNQVAHLKLDIRPMPDGYLNEETKKYLHLENGYNGFYIFNDLIFQDWIYKLTPQGDYIPDGEGDWQKEQLDHYVIGMPFTERLVPARVAVSSKAVLEELNDNYEMKLITLGSNVQIVDLAYYKQLWGATGDTFTEADFKALTAEWYDVNWDYDTPENQAIMKMYTYNGENGERLYRHQRAITFIPSSSNNIYKAGEPVEIVSPTESDFNNRTEPWYIKVDENYIYVSLEEEFDSNETYYTLTDQQSKNTVPSCDAVARYVESEIDKLDVTEVGGSGKYISAISETDGKISATAGDIDTTVTASSSNLITSGAVSTKLEDYVTLATDQTITGTKTVNAINFTYGIIRKGSGLTALEWYSGTANYRYFVPADDNLYSLGYSTRRYNTVYTNNICNGTGAGNVTISVGDIVTKSDKVFSNHFNLSISATNLSVSTYGVIQGSSKGITDSTAFWNLLKDNGYIGSSNNLIVKGTITNSSDTYKIVGINRSSNDNDSSVNIVYYNSSTQTNETQNISKSVFISNTTILEATIMYLDELKTLVANCTDFSDFKTAISEL